MADPQIRAIVRGIERLTERVVTKITLDVLANLIETTPVDTGWARANWVPSIGSAFEADLGGVRATPQAAASASQRQSSAAASVASTYSLDRGRVYITNNVPYVPRLNDGHSAQAPTGFVQAAIRKAVTRDIRGLQG